MLLRISRFIILSVFVALCMPASASEWKPTSPVRFIVPTQGGTVDLIARLVAHHLQGTFGVPVVVDARPGAGGSLATDLVAKSAPDGHTILIAFTAPITVNSTLMSKLPYDPIKDLLPITLAVSTPQFLAVSPTLPAKTISEFVNQAKKRPGDQNYASVSVGSASHLTMEMFKSAAGLDIVHIPFKGAGPAVTELLAGRVQSAMLVPANVMPYLSDGKLRVLATTGRKRFAGAPDVPTLIESGYPEFEATAWIGFMAPAGTPRSIIDRYHSEITSVLALPEVRKRLNDVYFDVIASTPEEFANYISWETPRWAKIINDLGLKVD